MRETALPMLLLNGGISCFLTSFKILLKAGDTIRVQQGEPNRTNPNRTYSGSDLLFYAGRAVVGIIVSL